MKLLFITTKPPIPESGSSVRNYNLVKNYLRRSINVDILYIHPPNLTLETLNEINKEFKNVYFTQLKKRSFIQSLFDFFQLKIPYLEALKRMENIPTNIIESDYDIIQFQEIDGYISFSNNLKSLKFSKLVIDLHNVDYIRLKEEIENNFKMLGIFAKLHLSKFKQIEIDSIKKVNHLFVCSEYDKNYFSKFVDTNKISLIPNGVDLYKFNGKFNIHDSKVVIFVGLLSYKANESGIKFYIDKIHPWILQEIPSYRLRIVGKNIPKWLLKASLTDKSIELTGFVDNIQKELSKANVAICPIYFGSGTRLKILEYLAMYLPVVSTTKGSEGINILNQKHIFLADTKDEFIKSVVKLLKNQLLRKKLSKLFEFRQIEIKQFRNSSTCK